MQLLIDTHLLLWAAQGIERLPPKARQWMGNVDNELWFSVASLWEIVIKRGLARADFMVNPRAFQRGLLNNRYRQLEITTAHVMAVETLPSIHKDPFDRLLLAQAMTEGMTLLTADSVLARYPCPVLRV